MFATAKTIRYHSLNSSELNRRIDEGIRRAPEERAIAMREFFSWITRR